MRSYLILVVLTTPILNAFVTYGQNNYHPQWSPVRDVIVFDSDKDGVRALYTVNANGSDLRKLPITFDSSMVHPSWSPDGKSLVFETQSANNWDLYTVNVDGTELFRLTTHQKRDFLGNWGPNANWITFVSDRDGDLEVFKIRKDGSDLTQLTHNEVPENGPYWRSESEIVFGSSRSGSWEIHSMKPDGSGVKQLTTNSGSYGIASSRGDDITFISLRDKEPYLQVVGNQEDAYDLFSYPVGNGVPSWSPGDSTVTLFKQVDDHSEIFVFDLPSQESRRLTFTQQ